MRRMFVCVGMLSVLCCSAFAQSKGLPSAGTEQAVMGIERELLNAILKGDASAPAPDAKTDAKEAWRNADGESLGDAVANTRDRAKDAVDNAADEIHEDADRASRDAAYEQGRADEMSRSR